MVGLRNFFNFFFFFKSHLTINIRVLFVVAKGGEGCLSCVNTSGSPEAAQEREKVSELLDLLLEADDDETEEQRSAIVQTLESLTSLCLRY